MEYKNYNVYKIKVKDGVAYVTIDNPPTNLINGPFLEDMYQFFEEVKTDDEVRVIVFQSADPVFFISHFDVSLLTEYPDKPAPAPTELGGWKKYFMEFRTLPKVTIAKIEGICGGGGNEFALSMDMRFGAIGKAIFNQGEAGVGIIAGGGGTHWLTRLMGGPRAMEAMLARFPYTARMAERFGWINRAIPADKIDQFVEMLANSIASVPAETIALVKKSIIVAEEQPRKQALLEEQNLFNISASLPESKRRMSEFVGTGGQERDSESKLFDWAKWLEEFLEEKE